MVAGMGIQRCGLTGVVLAIVFSASALPAFGVDNLLGHRVSISKYGGDPVQGKVFKLIVKAGKQGNPAAFPIPGNPAGTTNAVIIERDGGLIVDALDAGEWKGLGNPAGSKGWRYRNRDAPDGGPVKILLMKERVVKVLAKGTGSMPAPSGSSGAIRSVLMIDDDRYCTEASPVHLVEIANKLIKTQGAAPVACASACVFGTDNDGDRLDNCLETDTGVFASGFDIGSDPNDKDTDGDGLGDGDEVLGTTAGLDLPALGVSPLRRDILIEYDWFDDSLDCGNHTHRPTQTSFDIVTAAFAAAPLTNPDGSTGINFIHDRGQGGELSGGNFVSDADGVLVGGVNSPEFQGYKSSHFADERRGYFHYAILPHRYNSTSSSSGQAEIFGDDLIVSLYCANSSYNVAHTIVHELGHNLGLLHGGDDFCNYKPNYNSVMNYRYQFPGVDSNCTPPGDGVLDYSVGDRLVLDENDLDENDGVCGAPSWDWNGNSVIESSVAFDTNSDDDFQVQLCGGTLSTLDDHDDWGGLLLDVLPDPLSGAARFATVVVDCDNPAPMVP